MKPSNKKTYLLIKQNGGFKAAHTWAKDKGISNTQVELWDMYIPV